MKITKLRKSVKILILVAAVVSLSACSSTGSKNAAGAPGAHAMGLGSQAGFGDAAANKLKAPYDQTYYFEFDKFDVQQDDVASVEVQANYLTAHPKAKVRLEGNADERGSREYNVALGWKRAKAVAAILQQQGVPAAQIAMVSYGKEKPASLGHDEEAYRLNRRVNLVYEAK
jgi:peptidoglycan-associated lipoprotein